jgi:putative sigma-54 modulation protein
MDIRIVSKDFKVSDYVKGLLNEKLGKFDKYFNDEVVVKITFGIERENKKIEIVIEAGPAIFRAEAKDKETITACENAINKLTSQMSKYKGKIKKKHSKHNKRINFEAFSELPDIKETDELKIVRNKKVNLIPMTVEDALFEMEMISHDFFVFSNIENNDKISVVYRRKNGDYGILNS